MKKIIVISVLITGIITASSFSSHVNHAPVLQTYQDSLDEDRAKYVKQVLESIKGKENMRADSVFKNIKTLKIPAARLLRVMEIAYSKSLGVSCGHCHNTNDFGSEIKSQKEITRQMGAMVSKINGDLLKSIQGLKSNPALINCTTCHRGEVKPALSMPQ